MSAPRKARACPDRHLFVCSSSLPSVGPATATALDGALGAGRIAAPEPAAGFVPGEAQPTKASTDNNGSTIRRILITTVPPRTQAVWSGSGRIIDQFEEQGSSAPGRLSARGQFPLRELYVVHSDREELEITERAFPGLRTAG